MRALLSSLFWGGIFLAFVGLTLVTMCGCSTEREKPWPDLSKGPYVEVPGTDTMSIMWESPVKQPSLVWFRRDGAFSFRHRVGPVVPQEVFGRSPTSRTNVVTAVTNGLTVTKTNVIKGWRTNSFFVYRATMNGLRPGATYTYVVEVGGRQTPPHMFRTFNANRDFTRFVAYGDSRSNPKVHRLLAQRFAAEAPDFVLHAGDLVMAGSDYASWSKEFFDPVAKVADHVPILPVPGNHEEDLKNYLTYFPIRGTNRWYSFDAGPVHVLALDYHFEKADSEQFKFAQKDLSESRASWKVVFLHYPVFNYGYHNSGWGHDAYLPLFHKARVDLIIAGHTHMYERFHPIAPTNGSGNWAITSITTGGGGAELHQPYSHPAQAVAVSTNHFVLFEASRDVLRARAIRLDGVEIDAFEIPKSAQRQADEYLAEVYPEELIKLSYEVGPVLLAKLATLPTNQQPAKAMLTLPPLKTAPASADLEITLAPQSAKYYTVKELPLRVRTPARRETNTIVWITVEAIGKKKVQGPELDPPLVFKARVIAASGETMAYGPYSRTSQTVAQLAKNLARTQSAPLLAAEKSGSRAGPMTPRNDADVKPTPRASKSSAQPTTAILPSGASEETARQTEAHENHYR